MSSLNDALDAANQAISKLHGRIACTDPTSVLYSQLLKNLTSLIPRKDLLATYSEEMAGQINEINVEADERIEKLARAVNDRRGERIANVRHEFADKVAKLPALDVIELADEEVELKHKAPVKKVVTQYLKKYSDAFKNVSSRKNFFHAAACSNWFMCDDYKSKLDDAVNDLWEDADLAYGTRFPLSLAKIDKIIHSPDFEDNFVTILDTSLQVILTNCNRSTHEFDYLLIYDSDSNKFTPVPVTNWKDKSMCPRCFRFPQSVRYSCRRLCPLCLRTDRYDRCSKPNPGAMAHFCPTCQAYCQTPNCFAAHKRICPRPISGLRDDVLHLIKNLEF